jgi:hypothetical protein
LYVGEAKETDTEDRRLVIYLDNTQSKLRAKTLIYQALVATPDKIQEIKGKKTQLFYCKLVFSFYSFDLIPFFLFFVIFF